MFKRRSWYQNGLLVLGFAIIAIVAAWFRLSLLKVYHIGSDEAIHMVWLRLLAAGYQPYSEVYITYPPLYPLTLWGIWRLFPGESAQHWLSIGFVFWGALGSALLARRIGGMVAGLVAAMLVLFSPYLMVYSVAILGEFHAVAWAVWAVWFAYRYFDTVSIRKARFWLALASICLAASVLTKVLLPYMPGVLVVFIIARYWPAGSSPLVLKLKMLWQNHFLRNAILVDVIWLGAFMLLPIGIMLSQFDFMPLLKQVVGQRIEAHTVFSSSNDFWSRRWVRILDFVREDTVLVILAVLGTIILTWKRKQALAWLVIWLLLGAIMLIIHDPIRHKHLTMFVPPLAILASVGVSGWIKVHRRVFRGIGWAVLFTMAFYYSFQVMLPLKEWQSQVDNQPQSGLLAFVSQTTAPGDCLISDDMKLVYYSNRLPPPNLAEVSENRLASGMLTASQLIFLSSRNDCQIVAPVSDIPRFTKYVPEYLNWVKNNYLGHLPAAGNTEFYFAKVNTKPEAPITLNANFGGQILFHGYDFPMEGVSPGEAIPLTFVWQAENVIDTDYKIFVQVRDRANNIVASADHEPYLGYLPTSKWPPGAVIKYTVWLTLPPDLPVGEYPIFIGMYQPDSGQRLPIIEDTSGENALVVGPVRIK